MYWEEGAEREEDRRKDESRRGSMKRWSREERLIGREVLLSGCERLPGYFKVTHTEQVRVITMLSDGFQKLVYTSDLLRPPACSAWNLLSERSKPKGEESEVTQCPFFR